MLSKPVMGLQREKIVEVFEVLVGVLDRENHGKTRTGKIVAVVVVVRECSKGQRSRV